MSKFNLFAVFILSMFLFSMTTNAQSKCSTMKMDKKHQTGDTTKVNSIERKGAINFKSIDKNKDGKVFQCPMDAKVISDKQEPCPLCHMDLDEVTIKKAKENLK